MSRGIGTPGAEREGTMSDMQGQIRVLVELSRADRECSLLRERFQTIPREIERHQSDLKLQQAMLDDVERRRNDARIERRALERESDLAKARRRELEAQQHRVKNNTEYQALTREVEEMRRRSSESEDRGLGLLSEEEAAGQEADKLRESVAQEDQRFREVKGRLDAESSDLKRVLDEAEGRRLALVQQLDPSTRRRYERILESKGDTAVVGVAQGACAGCYYQLPPQKLNEVKKGASLIVCEGCGRIVIWDEK